MRKLLLTAVAAAAIASPAMARDGTAYVGIEAGVLFARNMNFDYYDGFDTTNNAVIIDHKMGYDVDLIGGYDFGPIRAELELARKSATHRDYTFDFGGTPSTVTSTGRTSVSSIMGNLLGDFGNQEGLSFYAGGGIGASTTRIRFEDATDSARLKDSHLAWQLIAGVRYALTPKVDIGLKYRYFRTKFQDTDLFYSADRVNSRFRSHSLLASLIYNFGAPAAPVMAPPPPPPPPPPPAPEPVQTQVCYDGSVIPTTSVCPSPPPPPPAPGERG